MTSELLVELLYSLALLSAFLLIGTFLRAKIKIFQKTFIPASVIGGFLALLLGPIVSGIIPIPQTWLKTFSLLPGILIVPIVASVPLGLKFSGGAAKNLKNIFPLFILLNFIISFQYIIGFGTSVIFKNFGMNFYSTFGWELPLGFNGGHGTAGLLGNILQSLNLPYWETAQGVAVTTATFGIIGGIVIGMIMINWAARKRETEVLKNPSDIPENLKIGYEKNINKQGSIGRETMMSTSIDTFAFHLALILAGCGIAYLILNTIKFYKVPLLSNVSIWAYAIIVMFAVWGLMCKFNIDCLVDAKVKSKIAGSLTEFAVVAAIASLPVKAIMIYIVPILFMVSIGLVITILSITILAKKYIKGYWFEHGIAVFGMSTGVFLTGLLLLRVCDPDFESPVLGNYSLAYTMSSVTFFALLQIILGIILTKGAVTMLIISIVATLLFLIILVLYNKISVNSHVVNVVD
jgi:glutamate:Na+ symporter, ESS family